MEQKAMSTIKDFFSKCDQIDEKLRIWSHLQKKSLMENFIFWAVFIKKRLQHKWLFVNITKFLRTHILKKISSGCF